VPPANDLVGLADRFVDGCPSPALVVESGGHLRVVNGAARALFGLAAGSTAVLHDLLGVGWREVETIARDGQTDLVTDLPAETGAPMRRGARVRLEPVRGDRGELQAVVAFVEAAQAVPALRHSRRGDVGFDALFGRDPELIATCEAAERFARTPLPILLLAETGTGKELLARAIHSASPRHGQPFVAINCGALSPHLLESELFGYAPGAFTGASRDGNDGKIGAARGGTLFLDEVAEMPGPLQALLLRVLEDGTYYRVGENRPRHADVRLICATCRDLPRLVAEGGFRQDLFYRINGACLGLPPVRRRRDVPELIRHLLGNLSTEQGRSVAPSVAPAAFDWMVRFPWPGNVRQLKTALQYALILADSGEIRLEHLPRDVASPAAALPEPGAAPSGDATPPTAPHAGPAVGSGAERARPTLAELESARLREAVAQARGNLSRAAADLGIARSTLYRRLRRHGLL
jgi:transcriptional regulator with PAS, ATPase and Fis domain